MPLVQACQICKVVACTNCATVECEADHARLQEDLTSDTTIDQDELADDDGSQFMISELGSADKLFAGTRNVPSVLAFLREHDMPDTTWVFKEGDQVDVSVRPNQLDEFFVTSAFEFGGDCPNCNKIGQEGIRRLCMECLFVGCRGCVADTCMRCAPGKRICKRCHVNIAARHVRAIHEEHAQRDDEEAQTFSYDWEPVLQCEVEASWQHIAVLNFPFGRTTVHRGMFADKNHVIHRLTAAGYEPRGESCILWGTSRRPDLDKAISSYIIVVPKDEITGGLVPIVCTSKDEEAILCVPNHQTANQWCEALLTPIEWRNGFFLVHGEVEIVGNESISFPAGTVLQKVAPWQRHCGDALLTFSGNHASERATMVKQADLPRTRSNHVTTISGYVTLAGKLRAIPRPRAG